MFLDWMGRVGATGLVALALVGCLGTAQATTLFGKDYEPCGDQPSTPEIVACTQAKTQIWDRRLNKAYADAMQALAPDQQNALKAAQRLWVQYRDANCHFYATGDGTIHRVQAAECLRAMTQDRALELEDAIKP